jgi:hypothetical protein
VFKNVEYLDVPCNEVTTIDNQSWMSIHVTVLKTSKEISLGLCRDGH